MVSHYLQSSFTGGEISPSLQARTDASAYHTWLKTAHNMLIHPQGGISNRPGTQYMAQAKSAENPCRLIAFTIGTDESYVIEVGEQYLRFHTAGGPVLDGEKNIYEISTPYAGEDIFQLQYAQYQSSLYVAHRNYPLYKLSRVQRGVFTWEEVALKGGPFQPLNTDETLRMRVYPQTQVLQSMGVAATLSIEPVNYSQWMVWAYFDGNQFYAGETFGLDIPAIVQAFNAAYNSQGLTAYNLGSIIYVQSAAQNGGDWNGKVFSIEYHHGFLDSPMDVFSQALSGGENAGVATEVQTGQYVLESDFSCFTPSHVGGLFALTHAVDAQYQSGSLGYESTSQTISCGEGWSLRTGGTWTGQLWVEISRDLGITWKTHKVLTRGEQEDNIYLTGHIKDAENMYLLRVRSVQITGQATYELTADGFVQRGIVRAISFVSATQMVVSCMQSYASQEWTHLWAQGSFSPAAGYPSCVFFYRDRLGLAATSAEPQTLWFSKIGNFTDFNHARDVLLDTDALSISLAGKQLNEVQSVLISNRLLVFTTQSEWTISCNGPFTLANLQLEQQSQRGAYKTMPVMVGGRALFVQARGSVLRDFYYDYSQASYVGDDLTWQAKHLFEGHRIVEMAFQQEPDSTLWCVLENGTICSLTYMPEQGLLAWAQHSTQGVVRSICSVVQEGKDQIWWVVERNSNYFIERFCPRAEQAGLSNGCFLDCAVWSYFSQPQQQVGGLAHLEGQRISALADGNVFHSLLVQQGTITLPVSAREVVAGLTYVSKLITLPVPVETGSQKRRLVSVQVRLLNSRGGKIGTHEEMLTQLCQRTHEAYNTPIGLQTGSFQVTLADIHRQESCIYIVQQDPLPLTVLAIITNLSN